MNDVVVHPNQGELISCDQAGRIKQWDLSENICTHELVCICFTNMMIYMTLITPNSRPQVVIRPCVLSASLQTAPASSRVA